MFWYRAFMKKHDFEVIIPKLQKRFKRRHKITKTQSCCKCSWPDLPTFCVRLVLTNRKIGAKVVTINSKSRVCYFLLRLLT